MAVVNLGGTEGKDVTELFDLLESNDTQVVSEIKQLIQENLSSTRESWLLNSLLDYYYVTQSERAMEILAGVREPHDKHLFDKLNEGLKHVGPKLLTLRLLLFTVIKQPSWIHKLIHTSVFNNIIKCLKHDTDIPTLMTAVLVITNYLPIDPIPVSSHLHEIFDIFTRLLAFNKKKPANIPDIFLLHLQVSVYALFHRLYGMFPCNFLAYLRNYFSRRDHQDDCLDILTPMIERVRLHPLLITSSKEYEGSQQRWRRKEIQDIVVDCAKMSLDVIEGTWEEVHCPIVATRSLISRLASQHTAQAGGSTRTMSKIHVGYPASHSEQDVSTNPALTSDCNMLWSPSSLCGLSTPPPSHMTSQQQGCVDYSTSIQHSYSGTSYTNTPLITPLQTPRATPPVIVDDLFDRNRNSRSNLSKRLSGSSLPSPKLQVSMGGVTQTSFESQTSLSVPPSPLRPEFTSEPPDGTYRTQPLPRTAQKLPFDDIPEKSSSEKSEAAFAYNMAHKLDSSFLDKFHTLSRDTITESAALGESGSTEEERKLKSLSDSSSLGEEVPQSGEKNRTMSIKLVDKVVQEMSEGIVDHSDDTDEEVREINQDDDNQKESRDSIDNNLQVTAESVQRFMRKVNRIRFNSLTISNRVDIFSESTTRPGRRTRSLSCPQPETDYDSEEQQLLRCSSAAPRQLLDDSQSTNDTVNNNIDMIGNGISPCSNKMPAEPQTVPDNETVTVKPIDVTVKNMENLSGRDEANWIPNGAPLTQREIDDNADIERILPRPFDRIMQYSLPYSAITRCEECKRRYVTAIESPNLHTDTLPTADYEKPLFSSFSPPELLDRHLHLGAEVHAKELSRIPITSHDSINWTHFGGLPPADEINILRGQILLIQNQLMYERHKRELHAKRNRRLLSQITHSKALEEKNSAYLDQLRLQENEIQSLQVSMKLLHQENQRLKGSQESDCYQQQVQLSTTTKDNDELKYRVSQLQSQMGTLKVEKAEALKMLQLSEYRVFNTERDLATLHGQCAIAKDLQNQIARLNKELLLMGELQQKYQEQLSEQNNKHSNIEEEYTVTSLQSEIKALKQKLDKKDVQMNYLQKKLIELEEINKHKDITVTDLKRLLESVKSSHQDELKAVENKYLSSMKISQQFESHMMDLYGQIEILKKANRQRGSIKVPADSQTAQGHGLGTSPSQSPFMCKSETLATASSVEIEDSFRSRPLPDWRSSPEVARSDYSPLPVSVLSHQYSSGSLSGNPATPALLSQSDAFSSAGPVLNQSEDNDRESAPAQAIIMETRHSPAAESQGSFDIDTDLEQRSTSSRSNTLYDSGVVTP